MLSYHGFVRDSIIGALCRLATLWASFPSGEQEVVIQRVRVALARVVAHGNSEARQFAAYNITSQMYTLSEFLLDLRWATSQILPVHRFFEGDLLSTGHQDVHIRADAVTCRATFLFFPGTHGRSALPREFSRRQRAPLRQGSLWCVARERCHFGVVIGTAAADPSVSLVSASVTCGFMVCVSQSVACSGSMPVRGLFLCFFIHKLRSSHAVSRSARAGASVHVLSTVRGSVLGCVCIHGACCQQVCDGFFVAMCIISLPSGTRVAACRALCDCVGRAGVQYSKSLSWISSSAVPESPSVRVMSSRQNSSTQRAVCWMPCPGQLAVFVVAFAVRPCLLATALFPLPRV